MAKFKTHPSDPAEFLDTPASVAAYLSEALASGNDAEFVAALNVVIRAHGLTLIAKDAGVSRRRLCTALKARSCRSETVRRTLVALGAARAK